MFAWFDQFSTLQQIYAVVAIPSTVLLILQAVLLLFGIGDGDVDAEIGGDTPDVFDAGEGFALFSIRGIFSMLALGGWSGIAFLEAGMHPILAVFLSFAVGFAALYLTALLMRQMLKLQADGSIDISNAIGKVGSVYLTIPAKGTGQGKVNLMVQERYAEFAAVTQDPEAIRTGAMVRVVSVNEMGLLLVERVCEK